MSKMGKELIGALEEALDHTKGKVRCRSTTIEIAPLPSYAPEQIKKIRSDMNFTQGIFASFLGVSKKTVEAWEQGRNEPSGPAIRLLSMAEQDKFIPSKYHIANVY